MKVKYIVKEAKKAEASKDSYVVEVEKVDRKEPSEMTIRIVKEESLFDTFIKYLGVVLPMVILWGILFHLIKTY